MCALFDLHKEGWTWEQCSKYRQVQRIWGRYVLEQSYHSEC